MISPELGKAAFRWAIFLVVVSGLLLLLVKPGTPQFVITVVMLAAGALFGTVVFVLVRIGARRP
ncbi:hypothetical protein [Tenggerimyces flavus]|uniref:Uncharacterized protein n=1 Tax=Tenggerimyces flavus TaxID=1708749 RepID=A0ABV7YN82_9ACTN|nr:hypothetical protein [Tenggerimyces flavus]MBM7787700.1 putative membrane protein [Tenggerimyces flavus]